MRISVSKKKHPYQGEETDDTHPEEESKLKGIASKSPLKEKKEVIEERLSQTKLSTSAKDSFPNDALAKLMSNRHKQDEILQKLEQVYKCDYCLQEFKVYDEFNDDPTKIETEGNVELIDETTFYKDYWCEKCYRATCPP